MTSLFCWQKTIGRLSHMISMAARQPEVVCTVDQHVVVAVVRNSQVIIKLMQTAGARRNLTVGTPGRHSVI